MRTNRCAFLALAAVGASAGVVSADEFSFSYFGNLLNGSGSLLGEPNGDGSFDITSGELYLTEGLLGLDGPLSLVLNPNGRSVAYSSSGYFIYNNQLSPDGTNKVDYYGLLFAAGNTEINIFKDGGDGPGLYTFYVHGPSGNTVDHGTLNIEGVRTGGAGGGEPDVPAPGAAALMVMGGAVAIRRRRAA